jgi:hypothetical protein
VSYNVCRSFYVVHLQKFMKYLSFFMLRFFRMQT